MSKKPTIITCPQCKMPIFSWDEKPHVHWKSPSDIAKEKISLMPAQQKQDILDLVHTGLTLGEVAKQSNVTVDEVCGIVTMNIKTIEFLSDTAE